MSSVTARKSSSEVRYRESKQTQKGIYRKTHTGSTVTLLKPSIQKVSKSECVKGGRETMAKFSDSFWSLTCRSNISGKYTVWRTTWPPDSSFTYLWTFQHSKITQRRTYSDLTHSHQALCLKSSQSPWDNSARTEPLARTFLFSQTRQRNCKLADTSRARWFSRTLSTMPLGALTP